MPVIHNSAPRLPDLEVAGPVFVAGVEPEQHGEPADGVFLCLLLGHVQIMPLESLERLVVGLPVDERPVALLRPEIAAVHVFLRHAGLGRHGRAPYLAVRELPEEFFVCELRARMQNERRLPDFLRARRRA